jgi:hypothetical protein
MTSIHFHQTVKIKQEVLKFDSFTIYRYTGTDKKGHELEVEFFWRHSEDTLTFEPIVHIDYTTKEETNADE